MLVRRHDLAFPPHILSMSLSTIFTPRSPEDEAGPFPRGTLFVRSPPEFPPSEREEDFFKELSEYATNMESDCSAHRLQHRVSSKVGIPKD